MYRKVFICTMLIISIFIAGCGKTELDAMETVNLYFKAALTNDSAVAKDTNIEENIISFMNNVDDEYRKKLKTSLRKEGILFNEEEIDQCVEPMYKLSSIAQIETEYIKNDETTANIKVKITGINKGYFYKYFESKLKEKVDNDEKYAILSANNDYEKLCATMYYYFIDALEETSEQMLIDKEKALTQTYEFIIVCEYNKGKKVWNLKYPKENITKIVNVISLYDL